MHRVRRAGRAERHPGKGPPGGRLWSDMAVRVDNGGYQTPTPWNDATWRMQVIDWVTTRLAAAGTPVTSEDDWAVRLRPWSVVIRIPVSGSGVAWFKANPPSSAFEPALMAALADWVPDQVLHPIAIDTAHAWSLLPDGGQPLTEPQPAEPQSAEPQPAEPQPAGAGGPELAWAEPLRQRAELQLRLTARVNEMLDLGVPDVRPAWLPGRFDELMDDLTGAGDLAGAGDLTSISALRPQIVEWSAELASGAVPDTLDHSDLHARQVFAPVAGRYRFFDWGDASIGHPFTSLLVTMRGLPPDARARVRDAYLEVWPGNLAELRRAAHVACALAPLHRALSWFRVFLGERAPVRDYILGWLRVLVEEPPI